MGNLIDFQWHTRNTDLGKFCHFSSEFHTDQREGVRDQIIFAVKQTDSMIHFCKYGFYEDEYGDLPLPPEPESTLINGDRNLLPSPESKGTVSAGNRRQNPYSKSP